MKNIFVQSLNQPRPAVKPLVARTLNGMRARATTSNAPLDLFGSIGASRGKNIVPQFEAAFRENKDLALRIAQWARDVRGGSGERELYRQILLYLEANEIEILLDSKLLDNLPNIGRFDDLLIFNDPAVKYKAYLIIALELAKQNGLAAKWLPRKGPIAVELRQFLELSPKQYRKLLVNLTKVVESDMCAQNWNEINFSHVPSVAMTKYMKAFKRNAPEQFEAYKAALQRNDGSAKVNAGAVYPYDVVKLLGGAADLSRGNYGYYGRHSFKLDQLPVAQAMWDALPDYMNGKNAIAVVDNSGSMQVTLKDSSVSAMDVATSLGLYLADKSKGAFKNLSITFSDNAKFVQLQGNLADKLKAMCSAEWGSTNLHSVFNLILNHAIRNRVPQADMPEMVVILSDMQFNSCRNHDDSALQMIRRKYEDAGYEMPQIVFWNLVDYGNKPVKFNDAGVALVSGFSPSILKSVLKVDLDKFSPENVMLETVNVDRYNW